MSKKTVVVIPMEVGGTRRIKIVASTPEERDEAIQRLNRCLPQLELLEQALQSQE